MSKLLENSFRQVNISLVNELNDVCRRAGIDTRAVINAASTKPYGFMKFIPGAGIGGHCIPVDPEYLQYFAGKFGKSLRMIDAASSVNNDMGRLIFDRLKIRLKGSSFSKGVILGIAYKANVADSRDTPAKIIIRHFRSEGFMIDWHDPLIENWEEEISSNLIENTWDFGIVVTAHNDLDINAAKKSCKVIFDCTGRYSFDPEIVQI
jgi:UDP-N-acetyl-D-glucosamine dehydrogenase